MKRLFCFLILATGGNNRLVLYLLFSPLTLSQYVLHSPDFQLKESTPYPLKP